MRSSTSPLRFPRVPPLHHGTGSIMPLDWSSFAVNSLIFAFRSVAPMCCAYLAASLVVSGHSVLSLAAGPSWLPASKFLDHYILIPWAIVEIAFSLYHAHLARRVQRPGPRPLYSRRFLDKVFSRVLRSGLGPDHPVNSRDAQEVEASLLGDRRRYTEEGSGGEPVRLDHSPEIRDPENWFTAHALEASDPRAIKFQREQSMWFHLPKDSDAHHLITRRDISQWLAWSLFSCSLDELEAEDAVLKEKPDAPPHADLNSSDDMTTGYYNAHHMSEDDGEEDPDLRNVLAMPDEWLDVKQGTRLDYLRKARRLLEARQGFRYPLVRRGPPGPRDELPGEGFSQGDESTESMRLTLDSCQIRSRPLLCYMISQSLSLATLLSMLYRGGFQLRQEGRLSYLVKIPASWSPEKARDPATRGRYRPTIFLHGLGIGLAQYSWLVHHLSSSSLAGTHPLMIPLQPHISQNVFSRHFLQPLGHHEMIPCLRRALRSLQFEDVQILSHSMGTIVHAWLLKSLGKRVARSCFVDPVCFRLFVPDVCGNFVYRTPENSLGHLMRYFVAQELGTANTLCRHFDWASALLWPEDEIPRLHEGEHYAKFFLAGEDSILNCKETRAYLLEYGVREEEIKYVDTAASGSDRCDWTADSAVCIDSRSGSGSDSGMNSDVDVSPRTTASSSASASYDSAQMRHRLRDQRPGIEPGAKLLSPLDTRKPQHRRKRLGRGGLVVDWKAAHGELLMKNGEGMDAIMAWLLQEDPGVSV